MAKVTAIKPVVEAPLQDGWSLVATQTGRLANGLKTTVLLLHDGEIRVSESLLLDNGSRRAAFAELVSLRAKIPFGAVESALMTLHQGVEGFLRTPRHAVRASAQADNRSRPTIYTNGRFFRDIAADALNALHAANCPPFLFSRGSLWVRVRPDGAESEALSAVGLKGILERTADFMRALEDGDVPARSPSDLAPDLLELPDPGLPSLNGISTVPVFLPGGRLLSESVFDEESGMLIRLQGLDGVRSDQPRSEALGWLADELLEGFPFADDSGMAHALAMLLGRFVRHMIDGPTPMFLIDAPAQGTGKSLLADLTSLVITGHSAPVVTLSSSEDELDKRITALLLSSAPVVLLDNVEDLRSTTLSAVLTTTLWKGRMLGHSKMVTVPNSATWAATGNNVLISNEMARRVIPIRLDAHVERPEERSGFRHPDLLRWTREHRTQLVSAALSLVSDWIAAGQPEGTQTLGRFEGWTRTIGGILDVAGVPGFLGGRARLHEDADAETRAWEGVCAAWWEIFGPHPITAGALFGDVLKPRGLLLDAWGGRSATAASQRIGHALSRNRDRVFGQWVIRAAGRDGRTRNAAYRLAAEKTGGVETTKTPDTLKDEAQPLSIQVVTTKTEAECFGRDAGVLPPTAPKHPQNTRGISDEKTMGSDPHGCISGVLGVLNPPASSQIKNSAGDSADAPTGEIGRCPNCSSRRLKPEPDGWRCQACWHKQPIV